MNKYFLRSVALLLIPGLTGDISSAAAFSSLPTSDAVSFHESSFASQALSSASLAAKDYLLNQNIPYFSRLARASNAPVGPGAQAAGAWQAQVKRMLQGGDRELNVGAYLFVELEKIPMKNLPFWIKPFFSRAEPEGTLKKSIGSTYTSWLNGHPALLTKNWDKLLSWATRLRLRSTSELDVSKDLEGLRLIQKHVKTQGGTFREITFHNGSAVLPVTFQIGRMQRIFLDVELMDHSHLFSFSQGVPPHLNIPLEKEHFSILLQKRSIQDILQGFNHEVLEAAARERGLSQPDAHSFASVNDLLDLPSALKNLRSLPRSSWPVVGPGAKPGSYRGFQRFQSAA